MLRILSAVFGALCMPLVYLIGRMGWGKIAGFVAAALIAVAHLHIHYSRMALNNIQSVWFALFCALMLIAAYEQSQRQRADAAQPPENPLTDDPLFDSRPHEDSEAAASLLQIKRPKTGLWATDCRIATNGSPEFTVQCTCCIVCLVGYGCRAFALLLLWLAVNPGHHCAAARLDVVETQPECRQLLVVLATFLVTFGPLLSIIPRNNKG